MRAKLAAQEAEVLAAHNAQMARARAKEAAKDAAHRRRQATSNGTAYAHIQSKIGQTPAHTQQQTGRAPSPLPDSADVPPPRKTSSSSRHTRSISSVSQASDGSATSAATSASVAASVAASASVAESVSAASMTNVGGTAASAAASELESPTGSVVTFADLQHPSSPVAAAAASSASKHRGPYEMISPVASLRPSTASTAAARAAGPYSADEYPTSTSGTVAALNQMRARGILTPDPTSPSVAPGLPGKRALEYRVPAPRAVAQSGVPFEPKHVPMRMVDAISLASHDVAAAAAAQRPKKNAEESTRRTEEKEPLVAAAAAVRPSSTMLVAAASIPSASTASPPSVASAATQLSPVKLTRKQARAAARAEAALLQEFPLLDRTGTSLPPRAPDLSATLPGHSVLGGPPRGNMPQPTYADSARKVAALAAVAARPNPDGRLIYSKVPLPSSPEEKEPAGIGHRTPEQVRARALELMQRLSPPSQRMQLAASASTPLLSSRSPIAAPTTPAIVVSQSTPASSSSSTTAADASPPAAPLSASAAAHALIYETPPLVPQVAPVPPPLIESVPPLPDPQSSAATVLWEFRELGEPHAHHVRRTVFDNPLATAARRERAERDAAAEARADALDAAREKRAGLSINLAHLEKFRTKQHLLTAEESAAIKHAATHLTSLTHAILSPQALQTLLSPTLSASMDLSTRDGRETLAELRFLQGTQIEMLSAQQASFKERLMRDFFIREAQERIAVQGKMHTDAIVRECAMKVRCAQRYLTHQYAQLEADHHAQNQDQQRWVEMEAAARGANRARERKARKAAGEAAKVKAFAVASSAPLLAAEAHAEILKANRIALQAVKTRYALYHDAHRGDPSDARVLETQSVPANRQQRKAAQASNVFHVLKPRDSLHDPTPLRNEFESTNPTVPAGNAALVFLTSFRPAPSKLDKMLSVPVLHDRDAHASHLGLLVDAPRSDAYVVNKIRAAAKHTAALAEKSAAEAAALAQGATSECNQPPHPDAPQLFRPSRPDLTREERGRERVAWARAEEAKKARLLMERKKAREDARREKLRVRAGEIEDQEDGLDDADKAAAEDVRRRLNEEAEEAAILGRSLRDADRALKRSGSTASSAAAEQAKTDSEIEEEAMAELEAEMKAKLALREALERESRPKPTVVPVTPAAPGSKQDLYARLASVAALASSASAPVLPVAAVPKKVSAHTAAIEAAAPHMIARQLELIKHVLPQGTERERRIKARIRNEMLMDFEFDAQNYDPFGFIQGLLPTPASPVVPASPLPAAADTPSSEQSTVRPGWNQPNTAATASSTPKHVRGRTISISSSSMSPVSTTRSRPGSISTTVANAGPRSRRSDSISSPGAGGASPGAGSGASPVPRAHGRAMSMSPSRTGAESSEKDHDLSLHLRPHSPQTGGAASQGHTSLSSSAATSAAPTPRGVGAHTRSATSAGLTSSHSAPSLEQDAQSNPSTSRASTTAGLRPPSAGSSSSSAAANYIPILSRPSSSSRRVMVHSFSAPLVEKIEIHRELHADELRFELERASEAIEEEEENEGADLDGPLSPSYAAQGGEVDPAAPAPTSFSFDVASTSTSTPTNGAPQPAKNAPNAPLLMSAPGKASSTPKAATAPTGVATASALGQTASPAKFGFHHSSRALVSTAAPVLSANLSDGPAFPSADDASAERVRRVQLIRPTMLAMARACLKKCPPPVLHQGQQSWRFFAPPHGLKKPWLSGLNVEWDELEEAADAAAMRKHQEAHAKRQAQEMHEDSARRIVHAASMTYEEANHTPPSISRPVSALLRSPLPIGTRPTTANRTPSVSSSRPGTPLTLHPSAAMLDAASNAADSPRSSVGGDLGSTFSNSRLQTPVGAPAPHVPVIWDQSSPPPVSPYFLNAADVLTTKGPVSGGGESVKALKAKWSKVESKLDVGGGGGNAAGAGKKTKSKTSKPKKPAHTRRISVVAEGTGESMVVHDASDDDNEEGHNDQHSEAASDTDTPLTRRSLRPATATTHTSGGGGFATQRSDSSTTTSDGSVSVRGPVRAGGARAGSSTGRNSKTPTGAGRYRDLSATAGYGTAASDSPSARYYPSNVLPLSSDIALTPSRWEKAKQLQTQSPSAAAASQAVRRKGTRDGVPLTGVLNAATTLSILHHVAAEVTLDLADPLHSPELRAKRALHAGGRGVAYGNLVKAQRKMEEGADKPHALTSRNAVDHASPTRKQLRSPQAHNGSASARASPSSTALVARNETVAAPLPALVLTPRALARRRIYTSSASARVHPLSDYALKSWLASHGKIFKQPILPQENSGPHSVLFQSIAAKDSPFKVQVHSDEGSDAAPAPGSHNMMDQPVDMRDVLNSMFNRVHGGHVPLNQLQVRALEKIFLLHFAGGMAHAEAERVQMRDVAAAEKIAAGSTKSAVKEASISSVEANHTGKLSVGQFVQRFICSSLEEWSHWWATQQDLARHSTLTSKAAASAAKHASAITALPHESALLPLPLWVPAYHRLKILERLMSPPSSHSGAPLERAPEGGPSVSVGEANSDLVDLWAHTQAGVADRLAEFTDSSTAVQKRISQEEEQKFARRLHRLFSAHLHDTLDQAREQRLDAREAKEETLVAAAEHKAAARALRLASPSQLAYDAKMDADTSAYASPQKPSDPRALSPAKLRPNSAAGIAAALSDVSGTTVLAPAYHRNQSVAASIMLDMNARLKSEAIRLQEVAAAANATEADPEAVRRSHARTASAVRARAAASGEAAPSTSLNRHTRTPTQKGLDAIFTAGANLPEMLTSTPADQQNLTPLPVAGGQRQFFIEQQQQQQPHTAPTRPSTSTELDVFATLRPSTAAAAELHAMREEAARQARIHEEKDAAIRAQAEAEAAAANAATAALSITVETPEETPSQHRRQLSVFIPRSPSNAGPITTVSISIEGPSSTTHAAMAAAAAPQSLVSPHQPSRSHSLQVTPAATRRPSLMESNADSILAAVAGAREAHSPRPSFSAGSSTISAPSAAAAASSTAPPLVPILLSPISAMHRRGPIAVLHRTNLVAIRHNLMVLEIEAQKRTDAGTTFDPPATDEIRRSRRASLTRPLNSNARLLPEPSRASMDLTGTTLADALASPPPPPRPVFLIDPSIPIQADVDLQRLNWAELQAALSSVRSAQEDALSLQAAETGEDADDEEMQNSARVLPVLQLPAPLVSAQSSSDSTAPSSRRAPAAATAVSAEDAAEERKKRRATGRLIDSDDEDAVFSSDDDEGKDEKEDEEDPGDVISKSLTILHASQIGRIESEAEEAARKLAELARRKIRSVNVFWHPEKGLQQTNGGGGAMVVARKKRASVASLQELSRTATPPVAAAAEESWPATPLLSESRRRSLEATSTLLKDVASHLESRAADARRMSLGKGELLTPAPAATAAASAAASTPPLPQPPVSATMSMALAMGQVVRNAMLAKVKEKAAAVLPPPTADAAILIAAATPAPASEVIAPPVAEPEPVSLDSLLKSAAAEVGADSSETKKIAFKSIKSRGAVEFASSRSAVSVGSTLSTPSPLLVAAHSGRLHSSAAGTGSRGPSATALLNATLRGLPPRAS